MVTGGSGFIATHIIKALLDQGARVRTTVRSLKNKEKVNAVKNLSPKKIQNLEIKECDLLNEKPWSDIV